MCFIVLFSCILLVIVISSKQPNGSLIYINWNAGLKTKINYFKNGVRLSVFANELFISLILMQPMS